MNVFFNNKQTRISPVFAMLAFIALMVALFYLAKGVFWVLSFVAPVLFIMTLFINRQVIFDYGKSLIKLTKTNPFMGIVGIVLSFVAFPLVSAFLFGKAVLLKKVGSLRDNMKQKEEAEYTDYEEIEEDDPLVLDDLEPLDKKQPEVEILKNSKDDNEYDDLFK